jgi:hypothetical protein
MTSPGGGHADGDEDELIVVNWVAYGAAHLPEVAARLEGEAQRLRDLAAMGWHLREPVDGGHGELEPPTLDTGIVITVNLVTGAIDVDTAGWPADDRRWPVITGPGGIAMSRAQIAPWGTGEQSMSRAKQAIRAVLGFEVRGWDDRGGDLRYAVITGRAAYGCAGGQPAAGRRRERETS